MLAVIGPEEFGSAIRMPIGIHRGANRRFWFYGANDTLEAQMAYLNALRKLTEQELQMFLARKKVADQACCMRSVQNALARRAAGKSGFNIMEHVDAVQKVGRNYIVRCPPCAEVGHDRSGDNLAILIDDPRFYKCWAGCTKEMIRAALGCPIPRRHLA